MRGFVLYNPESTVHRTAEVGHPMQLPSAEGGEWIEVPIPACDWIVETQDGEPAIRPRELPLALRRSRKWDEAKSYYRERLNSGFEIEGVGAIQTDPDSREAIKSLYDKATMMIAAGIPWSTSFKNQANEPIPVTAQQIIGIYSAVLDFGGACFTAKEGVGAVLDAATTHEELEAVDITEGYPTQPTP